MSEAERIRANGITPGSQSGEYKLLVGFAALHFRNSSLQRFCK